MHALLLDLLAKTLGCPAVPSGIRFRELGLDSAGAVGLAAQLSEATGRTVPVTAVWRYPTVEALTRSRFGTPTMRVAR